MNDKLTLQLFAFDCNAIPDEQRNYALAAIKKFGKALMETGRQQRVSGVRFTRDHEVRIKNRPLEKVKINRVLENEHSGVCQMRLRQATFPSRHKTKSINRIPRYRTWSPL